MIHFLSDLIPSLERLNQRLDDTSILKSREWVEIVVDSSVKKSYIFSDPNVLRITENGITKKSTWEYLGNNKIELEIDGVLFKFVHKFHDNKLLALKLDGSDVFKLLISEQEYNSLLNNAKSIRSYFESAITNHQFKQKELTPVISVNENEEFDIINFPSLTEELRKIKIDLEKYPSTNSSEIIISFAKNHKLNKELCIKNPNLCEDITTGKIGIKFIEELFRCSNSNSRFQEQLSGYIVQILL